VKEKILQIDKGSTGIVLPDEYLRHLELIPGAEVELMLDKEKKWIVLRPLHGEDFDEFFRHFKDSMESMA
jgi:bifunctional DNA-binding transcriptional regulator/antitoxin component of YhaV-PrlF toxin-antitoxin module